MARGKAHAKTTSLPEFRAARRLRDAAVAQGRSADEIDALTRVSAAAADAYRLEDVMEQAAEAAREVTGAASLSISRWERDRDAMQTLINVGKLGPDEERLPQAEFYDLAEYPSVARLLKDAKPYFTDVDDPEADPASVRLLRAHGKESEIAVPIVLDGEVWGEVWATTAPGNRRFDGGDVLFLQAIAERLATVLSRAERYSRVSRLAYEDPLTGLANRRAIEERLEVLLAPPVTLRGPLTLVLCDVDGLKDINDVHGHYGGDRALCGVGDALTSAVAPVPAAFVGRLGGDEFCVLLEGCPPEAASDIAAAALDYLAGQSELPVSLSFGAATARRGMTPSELMRAADRAQYVAKRRGGGRLCTADADQLPDEELDGDVRRPRRNGIEQRIEQAATDAIALLDSDLAPSPALDRIEAVAGAFSGALNIAAWAVSTWDQGSPVLHTASTADDRASRLRGVRVGLDQGVYRLADYPQSANLLRSGQGGFLVLADDSGADPAETTLLRDLGFKSMLAVAARQGVRTYMLELYADGSTASLAPASVRLQLLLRIAALGGPAS